MRSGASAAEPRAHRGVWRGLTHPGAAVTCDQPPAGEQTIAAHRTRLRGGYVTAVLAQLGPLYRPENTYDIGGLLGALEALDDGITTILNWSHALNTPEHADAALDALEESGSRAVLAHGNAVSIWLGPESADWSDVQRLRSGRCASDSGLVTLAMALRGPDFGPAEACTVLVRGHAVKRDGRLLVCDVPRRRRRGEASRDYLLEAVAAPRTGAWAPAAFVAAEPQEPRSASRAATSHRRRTLRRRSSPARRRRRAPGR